MESASSVLATMGISPEKVEEALNKTRDKRICICGHPMSQHNDDDANRFCNMSRVRCHCSIANRREALVVEDASLFRYASDGPGVDHALVKGLAACIDRGKKVEMLWEGSCVNPECSETVNLMPIVFQLPTRDRAAIILNKIRSTKTWKSDEEKPIDWRDAFMCPSCIENSLQR